MQVLLSFARQDAQLAAKLEDSLRHRRIDTWSSLDLAAGEEWRERIDRESAKADALVVIVGPGMPISPYLESEWRAFLRNDWESSKPLIPVLTDPSAEIPSFLRSRKTVALTRMDQVVDEIEYLLKHPGESTPPAAYARAKADQVIRLNELEKFALALKEAELNQSGDVERR
jgi:hypothetical protein